jgi:hypothetical protein
MPHRRKKSRKEGQPPKDKGANRRKAKQDPIAARYAQAQEDRPTVRSKRPRKAAGGKRKRSGPVRERGKKVAAAKKPTRRSAKAP